MSDLTCSLAVCGKDILGRGILLKDDYGAGMFEKQQDVFDTYIIQAPDDGIQNHIVILHPLCFQNLFDEMMMKEVYTAVTLIIASTEDLREGLQIP